MRKSVSLRIQFAFIFAVMIAMLTLLLSVLIGIKSSDLAIEELGASLAETSVQVSNNLDRYIWNRQGEVALLTELDALKNDESPERLGELFDKMKSVYKTFSWIGYTDAKGVVIASTDDILLGADISDRPVYTEGIKGSYVRDVHDAGLLENFLPNESGESFKFIDFSQAVYKEDGELAGVMSAHMSWDWAEDVEESIINPLYDRKKIDVFVLSGEDNKVLLGPDNLVGTNLDLDSVGKKEKADTGWVVETWEDDIKYLTGHAKSDGYKDFDGLGWTVLVRQDYESSYAPVVLLQKYILYKGSLLILLFAIVGWLVAGRIVKPLKAITAAADKLSQGEDAIIPVDKGIKDIEVLSLSLRKLIISLTSTESVLVKMKGLANHDALTGVPNRIVLETYMEEILSKIIPTESSVSFYT